MELKQQLRLTQQLIMTPQLQQAIKLLQLSQLELVNTIKQELEANPLLEEVKENEVLQPSERSMEEKRLWEYWENYLRGSGLKEAGLERERKEETASWENFVSKPPSLTDYLIWQLYLSNLTETEKRIGQLIIGNLDRDGYLKTSIEDLAKQEDAPIEEVRHVLHKIQELEPIGIAARDLKECLLLQIRHLGIENPLVKELINHHLHRLGKRDLKGIARILKVPLEEIKVAVKVILGLEPKPGRLYSDEAPIYIMPDLYVYKMGDEFVVVLNEDRLPKLQINNYYRILANDYNLPSNAREFIQNKFKAAVWFIKSIRQRQRTLYQVACSIFKFQRKFLEKGIGRLRPLTLKEIAEDIELHESTVSRITTNKYAQTPYGLFELKFFFNPGINAAHNSLVASASVKEDIRGIIEGEDSMVPYSDKEIADLLYRKGIKIARRTVSKYRESMRILPSSQRKKMV